MFLTYEARSRRWLGGARLVGLMALALTSVVAACGNGDDQASGGMPECAELSSPCEPRLYPPTFEAVYQNTLAKTCAGGGSSCHSGDSPQAGLGFGDPDTAHAALLADSTSGRARVVPGDAACSELMVRLEHSEQSWGMPVGGQLPENERCSIITWIEEGAQR